MKEYKKIGERVSFKIVKEHHGYVVYTGDDSGLHFSGAFALNEKELALMAETILGALWEIRWPKND